MPADYASPRFTLRESSEAADFPLNTLRSYLQRGWFKSLAQNLGGGRGKAGLLSLGDVLVLAIASRLIDVGMRPVNAYHAALPFALAASTPRGLESRRPFELFDPSKYITVFVWRAGFPARVVPVAKDEAVDPLLSANSFLGDDDYGPASVGIVINQVRATVFERLHIPGELGGD